MKGIYIFSSRKGREIKKERTKESARARASERESEMDR
jgi:hypothetical protein